MSSSDVLAPFLAELAIISYRDLTTGLPVPGGAASSAVGQPGAANIKAPPLPSELLSAVIVFGAFSFIPNDMIRNLLGWGIVIATLISPTFSGAFTTGSTTPGPNTTPVDANTAANAQPVGTAANPKGINNG